MNITVSLLMRGLGEQEEEETKMSILYRKEPLGERKPSPCSWIGKFRVGGRVCQERAEGC